ncbi:hypothetical protein CCMA1212_009244 [Trichoderma ghanense]|uniref:Uncharacterized protein n=1 Tax=Trichoderma ghanense TaxID=65468 RepID=A0ABY2GT20_9HYPO
MKSILLAATAATAVAGTSLLELGLNVDMFKTIDLGADLKLHLPQGLDLPSAAAEKPSSNPPPGHVNVWHPSHHGVVIDSCDDEDSDGWHWVHPCGDSCKPEQPEQVWTTSTVSVTSMHTVISCAPTVTNCPANGKHTTTVVVPETVTICPVEAAKTKTANQTPAPSSAGYPSAASSPANSPLPTNTAVVTLSTQTLPATGPAGAPSGYPVPGSSAPALTAPPAVPSGPASAPVASSIPAYPVPGNSSAPAYPTSAYSPPAQSSPAGSPSAPSAPAYSAPPAAPAPASPAGSCSGAYCAPPAGTAPSAAPLPTGNGTVPLPNGAVSRTQGAGMALFAGAVAALFL